MSAISDYAYYVHYWAAHAVKNTPVSSGDMSKYALSKIQSKSRRLQSGISQKVKQNYADLISAIHNRNASIDSSNIRDTQSAIEALVASKFKKAMIDFDSGKAFAASAKGRAGVSSARSNTTFIQLSKVSEIRAKVKSLQSQLHKIKNKENKGLTPEEIEALKNEFNLLLTKLDNESKNASRILGKDLPVQFKPKDPSTQYFRSSTELRNLLRNFNTRLAEWGYVTDLSTAATGFSEEAITLAASYMLLGLAGKELNKAMSEALSHKSVSSAIQAGSGLIGGVSSSYEFYVNGIPKDVLEQTYLNYSNETLINTPQGTARTATKNSGAQQKVDVVLSLPSTEDSLQLTPVTASVKNIDLTKDFGISLVSGTNLLYLLSDEDPRYLRRVFNVLAEHTGSIIGERGPENELNARASLIKFRNEAWMSIKYIAAYKALSGDTFNRQAAKLFIVNDSGGRNVYVLEIADIINLIQNSISKNQSALDEFFTFDYNPKLLTNKWEMTVSARMAKIINDIHSRKISVAFKNSAFNNIVNTIGIKGKIT